MLQWGHLQARERKRAKGSVCVLEGGRGGRTPAVLLWVGSHINYLFVSFVDMTRAVYLISLYLRPSQATSTLQLPRLSTLLKISSQGVKNVGA